MNSAIDDHLTDDALIALRIGRAIMAGQDRLREAISFKSGCAVVAPMFGDVLAVESAVMSVTTADPHIVLHVVWRRGEEPEIVDSREAGFAESIPSICARPAWWTTDYPERMRVELRSDDHVPERIGGLETISTLLLPFLELSRRITRLADAMLLLEAATSVALPRQAASIASDIIARIGARVGAPAAFYPAPGPKGFEPAYIHRAHLNGPVSEHLFSAFGRIPDGPVQRALASPPAAAPVTRGSLGRSDLAQRVNAFVSRLDVADYLALRVTHHDEPIGVIVCISHAPTGTAQPRLFTAAELATVASAAFVAGWAIPIAEQQARLRRALQESEMLRLLTLGGMQRRSRDELASMATSVAQIVFGADYVAIAIIEEGVPATFTHIVGNRTDIHLQPRQAISSDAVRRYFKNPQLTVIQDLGQRTDLTNSDFPVLHGEGLTSCIAAPFRRPDGGNALLLIGFRSPQILNEEDSRFAQSLAQTIAATF